MNNLKKQINETIITSNLLTGVTCLTIDTDLNVIYCVNREKQLISIDVNKNLIKECCVLNASQELESLNAICIEYLSEERCVFIALINGYLINYNTITNSQQFVGSFSDGLQSISLSFDQELIALLTKNNSLILMNKLFDVLAQKDLNTEEFGINKAVSVNWGSKSTQFHGEGKRDFRSDKQDFQPLNTFDDTKSRISWRGDGLYFVTSSLDSKTNNRILKVWSRDAVLQYTSEVISGLEDRICWRPSGNLIASSQMLANKHLIIFFEKNGLKHGEFELPFIPNTFKVTLISWSFDSELLLILGLETVEEKSKQVLMLWRQSNYKWDLKQNLEFTESERIVNAVWDPTDHTLLHILLSSGKYVRFRWKWTVDEFEGRLGLIDGKSLKITHFDRAVIPPPFCSYSLNFKTQVVDICLSRTTLAVILSDDRILLFGKSPENKINDNKYFSLSFENINKDKSDVFECFHICEYNGISQFTNLFLSENNKLYGIDSHLKLIFGLNLSSSETLVDMTVNIDNTVIGMSSRDNIISFVQIDGKLMKLDTNTQTITEWTDKNDNPVIFPQKCSQLELFELKDRIISICLSENMTLYLDNEVLSQNNCNSFIIFNDRFLLFSTIDHLLHCWPINDKIFDINKNYQNYSPRSLERGSKIIAVSLNEAKIVLQMPRGNIETIHPRMLLLDSVMSHLNRLQYDLAFELLRKHRINLNFLYDYKPQDFNNNIELFIKQIGAKSVEWICLFLTDLANEDFYLKLCSNNKNINNCIDNRVNSLSKIDLICDSMRISMDRMDSNKYFHPILLTYIKKSSAETDEALKRIKSIDDSVIRDEAIKFVLYVININTLFEEALGTYDFDILLMIASKSQKDPKEYLALMEELNAYESIDYKRYKIDLYLKRYKKALTHICKCVDLFEECLEFIRAHSLYRDAIVLFEMSPLEQRNKIWKLYGDYLMNKKYFEESAIAYKRCGDFQNAVKVYQLSGNWNAAIDAANHCSDQINVQTLARNLAKHLISIGKYCDASYLFEVYVKDLKESVFTVINGHEWQHAVRLLNQYSDEELLEYFRLELKNHFDLTLDNLTNNYKSLLKYKNRLECVRTQQIEKSLHFNSFDDFDSKSDIYSDTSSLSESNNSQRSTSSSLLTKKSRKSTKKSEKKKYVLKEGSVDEDIQLIFAINEIIKNTDQMQEEVSLLIKTLYDFCYVEESKQIQSEFSVSIDLINILIENIWPQNESQNQLNVFSQRQQISDPELSKAPHFRTIDWKLALI